jgi:hypothetical protein
MKKKVVVGLFLLIGLFSGSVNAAEYYVANNGSDSNPGTLAEPWKTMSKVRSQSFNPGDGIYFKRGDVWYETLTIPRSGNLGNPIIFDTYGTGERPLIDGEDARNGIMIGGRDHITIRNMRIKDTIKSGIRSWRADYVTIEYMDISGAGWPNQPQGRGNSGSNIFLYGDHNIVRHCELHDTDSEHGLYMGSDSDHTLVEYNLVYGNDDSGIKFNSGASVYSVGNVVRYNTFINVGVEWNDIALNDNDGIEVYGNLVYGTGRYCRAVEIGDDGPGLGGINAQVHNNTFVGGFETVLDLKVGDGHVVKNNIIYNDGPHSTSYLVRVRSGASVFFDYNLYYPYSGRDYTFSYHGVQYDSLPAWRNATSQDGNSMIDDPLFVNVAENNYSLQENSPACGTGEGGSHIGAFPCGQAADLPEDPTCIE